MLSDYRSRSFGTNYGLLISELGLLARAIVVIGKDRMVSYVEIVPEVASEPDYDAAASRRCGRRLRKGGRCRPPF